jgi:hypothetical protein
MFPISDIDDIKHKIYEKAEKNRKSRKDRKIAEKSSKSRIFLLKAEKVATLVIPSKSKLLLHTKMS